MDFFSSLLKAYERAELEGLVDQHGDKDEPVLLPLFHESKKAAKNIVNVTLNKQGEILTAEWLDDGTRIIFPVTPASVTRTAKPEPHPLVDKLKTYTPDFPAYTAFHERLEEWTVSTSGQVREFLDILTKSILDEDFITNVSSKLVLNATLDGLTITDEDGKTTDLSDVFIEFTVAQFDGLKDVSVTDYVDLHQSYITYMRSVLANEPQNICNISGKTESMARNHRTVFGRSGLISVSNHPETFKGRYANQNEAREHLIHIGQETTEKIHLMLKYLLENKNSGTWLSGDEYLVTWFDDDPIYNHGLNLRKPETFDDLFDDIEDNDTGTMKPNQITKDIGQSVKTGVKRFSDETTYHVAILNKTAPGRTSLKYYHTLTGSKLSQNLEKWKERYSWTSTYQGEVKVSVPSINTIITTAYGIDRKAQYLDFDNENFRSVLYQDILMSLIEGKPLPRSVVQKLKTNIRTPHRYPHQWKHVVAVSLGVLHKEARKEYTYMLDRTKRNRSYLFGRLLAIYDLIEKQKYYHVDGQQNARETNATRLWTAYTARPAKVMGQLENKVKPYEDLLRKRVPGLFVKLSKEKQEVLNLLSEQADDPSFTKPLDYDFIFGYNNQIQEYYTKKESEEK